VVASHAHRTALEDFEFRLAEQRDHPVQVDTAVLVEPLDEALRSPAAAPKSTASTRPRGFSTLRISRAHWSRAAAGR
jgi:hypothetical protein